MSFYIQFICIFLIAIRDLNACSSFYCINSCGSSKSNKGYKLILANNRDENIYRYTISADVWPPRKNDKTTKSFQSFNECYQTIHQPPFDLCVFGALDVAREGPPSYYSTWLAINERGNVGNLLFYMNDTAGSVKYGRGIIAPIGLQNSSWNNSETYLQYIFDIKSDFGPFNYVYLDMSEKTGLYSIYYLNNIHSKFVQKLNKNDKDRFIFSLSNSDLERPFKKVLEGRKIFENMIDQYSIDGNKERLIESIMNELLQSEKQNYPDENLKIFMKQNDEDIVKGVSQINANYSKYWVNAFSRTSSLILVDYDDNVEYYEYNLTNWKPVGNTITSKEWKMNHFKFSLNTKSKNNSNQIKILNVLIFFLLTLVVSFHLFRINFIN